MAQSPGSRVTDQWIRRWGIVVYSQGGSEALVLSMGDGSPDNEQLRVVFEVKATDNGAVPNTCVIKVYNPSPDTAKKVMHEFNRVTLQAGYRTGRYGIIFDGWVKMVKYGKDTPTDSYVEIYAADGDLGINNAVPNQAVNPPANTPAGQAQPVVDAFGTLGVQPGNTKQELADAGPAQPRPSIIAGRSAARVADDLARTYHKVWFVEQGQLVWVPATGMRSNLEEIILNGNTGLIGFPTQVSDGIEVRCLLNPSIRLRQRIRINNADINQSAGVSGPGASGTFATFPLPNNPVYLAPVSADGSYGVLVVEHRGDTRGNDWYTELVCWMVDPATGTLATPSGSFPTPGQISTEDIVAKGGT